MDELVEPGERLEAVWSSQELPLRAAVTARTSRRASRTAVHRPPCHGDEVVVAPARSPSRRGLPSARDGRPHLGLCRARACHPRRRPSRASGRPRPCVRVRHRSPSRFYLGGASGGRNERRLYGRRGEQFPRVVAVGAVSAAVAVAVLRPGPCSRGGRRRPRRRGPALARAGLPRRGESASTFATAVRPGRRDLRFRPVPRGEASRPTRASSLLVGRRPGDDQPRSSNARSPTRPGSPPSPARTACVTRHLAPRGAR